MLQPPNDNPCRADCTFCGDAIVNGTETCDDGNDVDTDSCMNDCAGILRKDPARIRFRSGRRITDQLKVRGGFTAEHEFDPSSLVVGVRLSNESGVIYAADLPAGSMVPAGKRFSFRDRDAKSNPEGGIALFWLKRGRNGRYHTKLVAYGDISAATTPEMTVELYYGPYEYRSGGTWLEKSYGWKLNLPWAN